MKVFCLHERQSLGEQSVFLFGATDSNPRVIFAISATPLIGTLATQRP